MMHTCSETIKYQWLSHEHGNVKKNILMENLRTYAAHCELGYCICRCCSWCFCLVLYNTCLPAILCSFWIEFMVMVSVCHIISTVCNLQILQKPRARLLRVSQHFQILIAASGCQACLHSAPTLTMQL